MNPKILAIGLAMLCVSSRAADLIPVEDFARPDSFYGLKMARDGKTCAALREFEGRTQLYFVDVTRQKKPWGYHFGKAQFMSVKREVRWFYWLGTKRVLFGVCVWNKTEGTAAIDADGKRWRALTGVIGYGLEGAETSPAKSLWAFSTLHIFDDDQHVLMLNEKSTGKFPDVVKLDTRTGDFDLVAKNPGDITRWLPDSEGVVRAGTRYRREGLSMIYRENEKAPWREFKTNGTEIVGETWPIGFTPDGKSVYLMTDNGKGFRTLRLCELQTGLVGEPMVEAPGYDMEFAYSGDMAGPVWSERTKGIVGFKYMTEGTHTIWFDPTYGEKMAAVDELLPGKVNIISSMTADESCWLIASESDRAPRSYYHYYPEEKKLKLFLSARPWVDPEKMASMFPIKYDARDGLTIHGYLTVPLGCKPQNLPLVVMPHGGPWVRDMWEYDSLIQMLANRGYAVLQMNYRGSDGYGQAHLRAGRKEIGGKIQNDIEDATLWAIKKKIADPKRIAIMGASYGGYSTLFALGKSSDMYRCGISICGVSDWYSLFKKFDDPEYEFSRKYWAEEIGDPEQDEEKLKAISPMYFANTITAPVLLIHGKDDYVVPVKQSRRMQSALSDSGRKPQTLYLADEGHGVFRESQRLAMFKAIEAFLGEHLGPGVQAAPAADKK